jgi:hypothetical protein
MEPCRLVAKNDGYALRANRAITLRARRWTDLITFDAYSSDDVILRTKETAKGLKFVTTFEDDKATLAVKNRTDDDFSFEPHDRICTVHFELTKKFTSRANEDGRMSSKERLRLISTILFVLLVAVVVVIYNIWPNAATYKVFFSHPNTMEKFEKDLSSEGINYCHYIEIFFKERRTDYIGNLDVNIQLGSTTIKSQCQIDTSKEISRSKVL